jgi:hypothetical protein
MRKLLTAVAARRATTNGSLGQTCAVALDLPCPDCGSQMYPEQAHNRCPMCLYVEPCCDGAPQSCRVVTVATKSAPVREMTADSK